MKYLVLAGTQLEYEVFRRTAEIEFDDIRFESGGSYRDKYVPDIIVHLEHAADYDGHDRALASVSRIRAKYPSTREVWLDGNYEEVAPGG